ncbi:transcription factor AP-2-beta [Trichonephila clavipes]|nr:transcription factor AP-2-beta [Trichonephila clavipes]
MYPMKKKRCESTDFTSSQVISLDEKIVLEIVRFVTSSQVFVSGSNLYTGGIFVDGFSNLYTGGIFVDGEAIHLAKDFGYVCDTEFPSRQVAEFLSRNYTDPAIIYKRKQELVDTREIIKEFAEFLTQDRSPLCNMKMSPILPQQIQRHLTHFSLITHGFGSHAIVSALSAAQNYINESIKYLDKQLANFQQAAVSAADVNSLIDSNKKDDQK